MEIWMKRLGSWSRWWKTQNKVNFSSLMKNLIDVVPGAAVLLALEVEGVGGVHALGALLLVDVGQGGDILMDVGLGGDVLVDVSLGGGVIGGGGFGGRLEVCLDGGRVRGLVVGDGGVVLIVEGGQGVGRHLREVSKFAQVLAHTGKYAR